MKRFQMLFVVVVALFGLSAAAKADDYGWSSSLNIQAESDPAGFRARLSTRFNLGDVQVRAVLRHAERPADAYMVLRLGEISKQSPEFVIEKYQAGKGKGWGALAQSLGIKPGSEEFHALKRGQDLYHDGEGKGGAKDKVKGEEKGQGEAKDKVDAKGKSEGKGKNKGR